jgi:hypothetical protein
MSKGRVVTVRQRNAIAAAFERFADALDAEIDETFSRYDDEGRKMGLIEDTAVEALRTLSRAARRAAKGTP